ncbi:MAG: RdgB/HAM1 family non-canonical purine NTP pyrophosphatase [Planctomycetes bacterium]|nr:RdgB/HAM1 family non-canonical purine NTP pyrophosphatase [Planctomycetota bacterium]
MSRHLLLIATTNPGKLREIKAVFAGLPLQFEDLRQYPDLPAAVEDADTFMANAEKKALYYAEQTGLPALADDSGLEVDCLGGRPGVHSARFAGRHGDDQANNAKLIELLRAVPLEERSARFRCAIVVADCGAVRARAEGAIEGLIIDQPRGENGFGYDPHFLVPDLGKTTAELAPEHKNRISHRGQALRSILDVLGHIFAR